VAPWQYTVESPIIFVVGLFGNVPTTLLCAILLQLPTLAVTDTRPDVIELDVALIEVVFEVPVQPFGNVQV
jgi:hypothetical protein